MFDSIMQFFQDAYNSTIGALFDFWTNLLLSIDQYGHYILVAVLLFVATYIFKYLKTIPLSIIVTGQVLFLTFIITTAIAFVGLIATSLIAIYNRIHYIIDYLSNTFSGLDCFYHFIDCLHVGGILNLYFNEVFALFVAVLIVRMSKIFIWAFNLISDKIWKLGVLLGLM